MKKGFTKYQSVHGFAPLIIILVIVILGVVGYFAFKNYLPKSQLNTATEKPSLDIMVGVWQASPSMAAGWAELYQFFSSGKFNHNPSSMSCCDRGMGESGYWKTTSDGFVDLEIVSAKKYVGGNVNKVLGQLLDGKIVETVLSVTYKNKIPTKRCEKSAVDYYPCLNINGKDFYKFSNDPTYGNAGDLSSEPDFILVGFAGKWEGKIKDESGAESVYTLDIEENGDYLSGKHCFVVKNAARSDCDSNINTIYGLVSGKTARINLVSSFSNGPIKATLNLDGQTLTFKLSFPDVQSNETVPNELIFYKISK